MNDTQVSKRRSLTPKPNEIEMPYVNPVGNKNIVTRHHMDDTEAYYLNF
jgi:hypothetical protein